MTPVRVKPLTRAALLLVEDGEVPELVPLALAALPLPLLPLVPDAAPPEVVCPALLDPVALPDTSPAVIVTSTKTKSLPVNVALVVIELLAGVVM